MARLLGSVDDLEVVAAAVDYDSLLAAVAEHVPDVVLTDIRMPPTETDEGIRAAAIRAAHPSVGVVLLSQYAEPDYAMAFLGHGSDGRAYLLKERVADLDQLRRAIVAVSQGGSVIDPKVVEALLASQAQGRVGRGPADAPRARCWPRWPRARTTPASPPRWC